MNVQYAIKDGDDLRARSQPARLAHRALRRQGHRRADRQDRRAHHGRRDARRRFGLDADATLDHIAVKEAVFPFARFPGVDIAARPGDALDRRGHGPRPRLRAGLRQEPARRRRRRCRATGTVFVSVRDDDKPRILPAVQLLAELGFKVLATGGTQRFLDENGVAGRKDQQGAGRPPAHRGRHQERRGPARLQHHRRREGALDSRSLRRAALLQKVPYYTTLPGAIAAAEGIEAYRGRRPRGARRCRTTSPERPDGVRSLRPRSFGQLSRGRRSTAAREALFVMKRRDDGKGSDDGARASRRSRRSCATASRSSARASSRRSPRRARTATCRRTPSITPPRKRSP